MKRLTTSIFLFAASVWAGDLAPFWTLPATVDAFQKQNKQAFDRALSERDKLLAVEGPRTVRNTLVPFDEANGLIRDAVSKALLLRDTHPDGAFRRTAEKTIQEGQALLLEIQLDPRIYQALALLERVEGLNTETTYYVRRTLKLFRNAGVDKSDEVRRQIRAVRAEIVKLEQQFGRNIVDALATVSFEPEALEGTPEDFIRSHTRQGKVYISNDRADFDAVISYAKVPEVRRKTELLFWNRGYPANMDVLSKLIELRHRAATLCGFSTFADMEAAIRMIGSEAKHREFLDEVDRASRGAAASEAAVLLEAKRHDRPDATALDWSDEKYYILRVRNDRYGFDERQVREYFPYNRVKESIFEISTILFGVTFQPVKVPVWHSAVETYNVLENGAVIGRIYLDMFPRKDKYQHFESMRVRIGLENRQLPEAALICNMPAPGPGNPALMTSGLAGTFFHEFGHLLHTIFSGRQRWAGLSRNESDFIEAPSQMLEEWWRNPMVLTRFARHYKTGGPIGASLVARMVRAQRFGEAMATRFQLYDASESLEFHSRGSNVDTDSLSQELSRKYMVSRFPDGAHDQCSFPHLGFAAYAATYYTYLWSLVIARDLLTGFNPEDLMDPGPARKYRRTVLEPGGSMPAAQLVENFLGRPFNIKAYQEWLLGK